jgi:type II secretory pathway component PulF
MSAGNLIGSIYNTILAPVIWIILGYVIEKIVRAANTSMKLLPTMQDAINGMEMMQYAWVVSLFIVFCVIWINYALNENSQASGGV